MSGLTVQKKYYPIMYDYKNQKIGDLTNILNISQNLKLQGQGTLSFSCPIDFYDIYGRRIKLSNGKYKIDEKSDLIRNEYLIKYRDNWYKIKNVKRSIDEGGRKIKEVTCRSIEAELLEKYVRFLDLSPPIHPAVNVIDAIRSCLEVGQQVRDNFIVSSTINTATLDLGAHPENDYYKNMKIKIISGTGQSQERDILAYNSTTKAIIVGSNWATLPDTTSVYRIYNDVWKIGTVDSDFLVNEFAQSKLRAHKFDYATMWNALDSIKSQYIDSENEIGYFTFDVSYDSTKQKWTKIINLKKANLYSSTDIVYGKNMTSIVREEDTDEFYTRIIPSGKENLTIATVPSEQRVDNAITYYSHVNGYDYIDNFQYFLAQGYSLEDCRNNFVNEYRFDDPRYVLTSDLYSDAKKLLNKFSIPKLTYRVSLLDLSVLTGREQESFGIGDTIRVINSDLQINVYAVIQDIQYDGDNPQNSVIELTNIVDRFADLLEKLINKTNSYTNKKSISGKSVTFVIADELTTRDWSQADYVIRDTNSLEDIMQKIIDDYVGNNIGVKIVLLDGVYSITKHSLSLKINNLWIQGQGDATLLTGAGFIAFQTSTGFDVENVSITDMRVQNFSTFARIVNTSPYLFKNLLINNVNMKNLTGYYVYVQRCDNTTISGCTLENVTQDINKKALQIFNFGNISVLNNKFINFHSNNITILNEGIKKNIDISMNVFETDATTYIQDCLLVSSTNPLPVDAKLNPHNYGTININDNIFRNTGSVSANDRHNSSIHVDDCVNVNMFNNRIINHSRIGVKITDPSTNIKISENTIINCWTHGIKSDESTRNIYQQNKIISNIANVYGIYLGSGENESFISSNDLAFSSPTESHALVDLGTNNNKGVNVGYNNNRVSPTTPS